VPHRGRKNEPAYIAETMAALATVRGLPAAEVDAATSANARRLFGLPWPSGSADTRNPS
jgi:TatD DNase family protein